MEYDVFISYSVKDKVIADALCHKLEEENLKCWIAPRDIRPGGIWASEIASAIPKSKTMLLIFSSNANSSEQVLREVELAIRGKLIIIPLKIEDVLPTGGMSYYLSATHWIDAVGKTLNSKTAEIGITIKNILGINSEEKSNTSSTAEIKNQNKQGGGKNKNNTFKVVFISIVIILSGVIIYLLFGNFNKGDGLAEGTKSSDQVSSWKTLQPGIDPYAPLRNLTPSPELTAVPTPTATPILTPEATLTPTDEIIPTQIPTAVPVPTATQMPESTTTPTVVPTPTAVPTPIPEKLSIAAWEENVFVSEWAELWIPLPSGWYKATDEEILIIYSIGAEVIAGATGEDTAVLEDANYIYPMLIMKYPLDSTADDINTNMVVFFEKIEPPNDLLVGATTYINIVQDQYISLDMGYEIIGDITEVQVGDKTYSSITMDHEAGGIRQVFLCRKHENFIIGIIITAAIDGQSEIETLIESIEKY